MSGTLSVCVTEVKELADVTSAVWLARTTSQPGFWEKWPRSFFFAWHFRSFRVRRIESAFWLRSCWLGAEDLFIYFHCLVPSGGDLFCRKELNQSLQWQRTLGALITIQNILRANKSSQRAISWWYFSSSHVLSELILRSEEGYLRVTRRSSSLSQALAYCSGPRACEMHFTPHLLPKWDVKAVHTSFTFGLLYGTA